MLDILCLCLSSRNAAVGAHNKAVRQAQAVLTTVPVLPRGSAQGSPLPPAAAAHWETIRHFGEQFLGSYQTSNHQKT